MCRCGKKACRLCELRKLRKRAVKDALRLGGTVPYEMRTLLDDGWSAGTIRRVFRSDREWERLRALEAARMSAG